MKTYSLLTGLLFATDTKFHTLVYYKKLHTSIFKKTTATCSGYYL